MKRIFAISFGLATLLVLAACGTNGPTPLDPTSITLEPAAGAVDVTAADVSATFASPVRASSWNGDTLQVITGAGRVAGTVSYDADSHTLTFEPDEAFAGSTTYTVTLAAGVALTSGARLSDDLVWTFTTAAPLDGGGDEPGDGEPGDGEPGDGEPGDGEPGDGEPGDGEPGDGEPGDGEPSDDVQVTFTLEDASYTYDGTAKSVTVVADPADAEYSVTYTLEGAEVTEPTAAGTYQVQVVATGEGFAGSLDGELVIGKATLVATVHDSETTYDGEVVDAFDYDLTGFVAGEDDSVVDGSAAFTSDAEPRGAGSYQIGLEGLSAANYDIEVVSGTLTILPAPLTASVRDASVMYEAQAIDHAYEIDWTGFVAGDDDSVVDGTAVFTVDGEARDVGSYAVSLSGLTAADYTITTVPGTLTITPAPLTIRALDQMRLYNGPVADFELEYIGLLGGDPESVAEGEYNWSGSAWGQTEVGTWEIVPPTFTAQNYDITFENGTLTIVQLALLDRSPAANATGVARNVVLEAAFDHDVSDSSVYTVSVQVENWECVVWFFGCWYSDWVAVGTAQAVFDGETATFQHSSNLAANTDHRYRVQVRNAADDLVMLQSGWTEFRTGTTID